DSANSDWLNRGSCELKTASAVARSRKPRLGLGEATPVSFPEAGFFAFGSDLLEDSGVQSRGRGLTAGGVPVALSRHRFNHFLAGHGLPRLTKDLSGGFQCAELWGLFLAHGLLGFLGFGFLGIHRCCHDTSP